MAADSQRPCPASRGMTNEEVFDRFDIRWNGTTPLLPEYESATTLTESTRARITRSANPMIRIRPHDSGKPRKYSTAHREALKALRQDGFTLVQIAEMMSTPLRTVHSIVRTP